LITKRRIFIPLFLSAFSTMLGMGIIAPLLPVYAQKLGATTFAVGLIFASFSISRTIFLPLLSELSDRRGRKIVIVSGLSLFVLTSIGYVLSRTIPHLIVTRCLQGIAAALVIPASLAYMAETSPSRKEGTFMGIFNLFFFGGLGMGPLLGGLLKDLMGIESSFYAMGSLASTGLVLTLIFLPEKRPGPGNRKPSTSVLVVLREPTIRGILAFRFFYSVGVGLLWSYLPLFADNVLELSSSKIGVLVSLNVLVATVLQAPFGVFADRMSKRALVVVGGGMSAFGFALIPYCLSFTQIFWISVVLGVSGGILLPALTALVVEEGKRTTEGMGRLMGFFVMAHSLGMIVGPLVAGLVAELASLGLVFLMGALIGVVGIAFLLFSHPSPEATTASSL
jgi:MFS family permease